MSTCLLCQRALDNPNDPTSIGCNNICLYCRAFLGDFDAKHEFEQAFALEFKALYRRYFDGMESSLEYADLRARCQDRTSLFSPWINTP